MSDMSPASILDDFNKEVFLVTTCSHRHKRGMIVTWVTAASLIPGRKRLVLVVSPHHSTTQGLLQSRTFILHRLAREQVPLVPTFGLFSSREVDKFAQLAVHRDDRGLPIIPGTCGWARGNTIAHIDGGDRLVVLVDVDKEEGPANRPPLFVRDLAHALPGAILRQLEEKYRRDIARDRQLSQHTLTPILPELHARSAC
jgi:flavin reductase (DIM6/NTAB) family NADH-FMN oxidoreductase RutF